MMELEDKPRGTALSFCEIDEKSRFLTGRKAAVRNDGSGWCAEVALSGNETGVLRRRGKNC
jgi:hypothetical protein